MSSRSGGRSGAFDFEWTGLRELNAALKKMGVTDQAVKDAMNEAGGIMQKEAFRLAPMNSGKMLKTLKVNKAKNELVVSVGNNTTVKYAHTFHVIALSEGAVRVARYNVKAHTRRRTGGKYGPGKGGPVKAYTRGQPLKDRPFMFQAAERKGRDVRNAYVTAINDLIEQAGRGL